MDTIREQNARLLNFAHIVSHNLRSHTGNLQMLTDMLTHEKDETEKQSKVIKDKTEKIINEELRKQVEDLKEQNEELKQQIKQKVDSIYKSNLTKPQGGA